jgi:hypothetical protein
MNAIRALEVDAGQSPLEAARTKRGLTREEAAAKSALGVDEITWLEEGRLYRFRSAHQAVAAAATYASALGVDHHEALALAGRPVPPLPGSTRRYRLIAGGGIAGLVVLLIAALAIGAHVRGGGSNGLASGVKLPPPENIRVDVLNGAGDINYTKSLANKIVALGYDLRTLKKAPNFGYRRTSVYYPWHAEAIAARLGKSLCVGTTPLPGSVYQQRLVVIVGPPSVGGC